MVGALVAAFAAAASSAPACPAELPHAPEVPAAIVLRTSCGGFRLAPDGRVTRLPAGWFARHAGWTGRRYGADLKLRRTRAGGIILRRGGRTLWRSSGLYRNDGGSVAFGPGSFAFAAHHRGVFLTDLDRPERLVLRGRGLFPMDFTRRGELLVGAQAAIIVLDRRGRVVARHRHRHRNGYTFDPWSETLYFVSRRGVLTAATGGRTRPLRRVADAGWLWAFGRDRLVLQERRAFAVLDADGTTVAETRWGGARPAALDSGPSASADGRWFAFRRSSVRAGSRRGGLATVYLLRSGETQARPLFRHRLGAAGCAPGANLTWHGRFVLYDAYEGGLAVLDTLRGGGRDLTALARSLSRRQNDTVSAYWASQVS